MSVPILAAQDLTKTYGRGPDRERALDAGFDEHLVKPVELDALLTTLNRVLADSAAVAG